MSLRAKLILYLVAIHLPFAAVAVWAFRKDRLLLVAVEVVLVLSAALGIRLVRALFVPLDLLRQGASFLSERDFGTRLLPAGQPELDELVAVYNRMLDSLREERLRLEEQQQFLEKVLAASPSGILTLGYDGPISFANPRAAALLGGTPGELAGKQLAELGSPFAHALQELPRGASGVLPLQGGRRVKVQRGEFLDRGFPRAFFVLEELTEELRQSEKAAYEKLIRMMSHEVNNSLAAASSLLTSCLAYAEQIRKEDREDFTSALSVVLTRAAQLSTFMRDFAEVVRIPPPRLQPTDVAALLGSVAALLGADAANRRIRFAWQLADPLENVPLDRRLMEQVFVNVIKNALEAVGTDGTVTIRSGRTDARRYVAIEDSGPGILPDAREQLFRPFYSTKENGQGIGLTVAQEILRAHGFGFSLESERGRPTTFTVVFG